MENDKLLIEVEKLIKTTTIKELAIKLNVSSGTISRWIKLKNVPKNYTFDILKLTQDTIDYSIFSSKYKDQFYTSDETVKVCYDIFEKTLNINKSEYVFIEPSAGNGSFLNILPENTISMDIEPKNDKIKKCDYLSWFPEDDSKKYIVFGNPPFGLRGHLALKFINHSFAFADYVCFILPQLFESDGKGSPRKRINGYNLIKSHKLNSNFYEPNKKKVKINTIFQIWSKNEVNTNYSISSTNISDFKVYSLSDGGSSSNTRNKNMINHCDIYIPSTCFGAENMRLYKHFNELPGKRGYGIVFNIDKEYYSNKAENILWDKIAFLSTNSAYNLRTSQIINALKK